MARPSPLPPDRRPWRRPWLLVPAGGAAALLAVTITSWSHADPDAQNDRDAREAWTKRGTPAAAPQLPPDQVDIQVVIRDAPKGAVIVIDTRDAAAYAGGHISKAFTADQLTAALAAARGKGRKLPIVVIGHNPQDPGPQALAEALRMQGHRDVLTCPGGLEAWLANHQDLVR